MKIFSYLEVYNRHIFIWEDFRRLPCNRHVFILEDCHHFQKTPQDASCASYRPIWSFPFWLHDDWKSAGGVMTLRSAKDEWNVTTGSPWNSPDHGWSTFSGMTSLCWSYLVTVLNCIVIVYWIVCKCTEELQCKRLKLILMMFFDKGFEAANQNAEEKENKMLKRK